jgi:peptidoglycan/LPS O-acetylase OafA/YrhL
MKSVPQFHHVPELDGIRAVAVFLVMASHAGLSGKVPGGFGVTMFFFLSGYLITSLMRVEYMKTGIVDFRAFYLRRVLRIMPPLYITLVILTIFYPLGIFPGEVNWPAVPWDYLFLSNYSPLWGQTGGLPSPLWSLAIEEHFYLLFPAVFVLLIHRLSARQMAAVFAGGCVFILLLRFVTVWLFPALVPENYIWTHTRLDSILFGCILAMYQNPLIDEDSWRPRRWHAAIATLLILSTFAIRGDIFRQTVRYSIQGVGLFVLFSFVLSKGSLSLNRVLGSRPFVWIGLLSYTLYLCHMALFEAVGKAFHLGPMAAAIAGLPLALLFAQLMRNWVEVPILGWRRKHRRSVNPVVPDPISLSDATMNLETHSVQET